MEYGKRLVAYLKTDSTINGLAANIGMVINTPDQYPYIWLRQAGQRKSESNSCTKPDATFFDIEIVGDKISEVQPLTDLTKTHLENASWPSQFSDTVQYIEVDDHGDDYISRNPNTEALETSELQVTLQHP